MRGEVICNDAHDGGIVDRWIIETYCYPIEPKPGDLAAWMLRPPGSDPAIVTATVGRQTREYYISKQQNIRLEYP
jgi:hypothetical protein